MSTANRLFYSSEHSQQQLPASVECPLTAHSSFRGAEERGWAANIDGFYTSPRTILKAAPINATIQDVALYARMLHVLAAYTGWSLQVPANLTASGHDPGTDSLKPFDWEYTRTWSRYISVEPAMVCSPPSSSEKHPSDPPFCPGARRSTVSIFSSRISSSTPNGTCPAS